MKQHAPLLIVEDNPQDLDLACRAFKRCNLANPIENARDGDEVLSYIARWEAGATRPRLILLDLNLPKIGGPEVLQALKSHPISRSIPVVVLSTSAARLDVEEAYALGANSYLVKPINFDSFLEVAALIDLYWMRTNCVHE